MLQTLKNFIIKFYWMFIKHDWIGYARKLGVRWQGGNGKILSDPQKIFGSEPWLITLGDYVYITSGVRFITHNGSLWCARVVDPELKNLDSFGPIVVGNNVSFGLNVIVMPGVTIGNNVIIGSNCVVTKDIPDNSIVAGVPGKVISSFDDFLEKTRKKELVPTKGMTGAEKKKYLEKLHPEWFRS